MMRKYSSWFIVAAIGLMSSCVVIAQTPTSNQSMQQLRGRASNLPAPLLPGQFYLARASGSTGPWIGLYAGYDTSNELLIDLTYGPPVTPHRQVLAGAGLGGGGDLSADRTLYIATTGVTAGTYGSATTSPVIVVNTLGQITSASSVAITGGGSGASFADNESIGVGVANLSTHNQDFTLAHTPISGSVHLYVNPSGSAPYDLRRVYSSNFTVSTTTLSIPNTVFTSAGWTVFTSLFYVDYRY